MFESGLVKQGPFPSHRWQEVEFVLEAQRERGLSENMTFYNAVLDALWELGQHARAVKLMQSALARGTFPEAVKRSETIWAVDVHRMSSGAALALLYSWLVELRAIRKVGVWDVFRVWEVGIL